MDFQRTLLIVGLAVVSYLMILQWQEDYGQKPTVASQQVNPQSYPQGYSDNSSSAQIPASNTLRRIHQIFLAKLMSQYKRKRVR